MNKVILKEKKNIMKKPELLAPAGDLEKLKIAFLYGADAVYCGGVMFGLRANATNFTFEELEEGIKYAHNIGKKVYVTVNIILHSQELEKLIDYLKKLEELNVDAIIVSDPAVIDIAKKHTNLEIHLSTQQSTLNYEACLFWKNQGVTRIVLGREANKEDIKEIIDKTGLEIECFIHGAMCSSISGRCVLSNYLTARDANRGGCSQICRWDFELLNENKEIIKGDKNFTFCTKDLSLLKYIPDMIERGITSFKIEGRMRSVYYIATVVNIYRKVIDEYWNNSDNYEYNEKYEAILNRVANRDSKPQFYDGVNDETCGYYNNRIEISNQDFLGIILDYDDKTNMATIEQRNYFKVGDTVEIFGPNKDTITLTIEEIYDEDNNKIEIVNHPKQIVKIKVLDKVGNNDLMRVKVS